MLVFSRADWSSRFLITTALNKFIFHAQQSLSEYICSGIIPSPLRIHVKIIKCVTLPAIKGKNLSFLSQFQLFFFWFSDKKMIGKVRKI